MQKKELFFKITGYIHGIFNHFPRCFHLLPMDAQWMLNGCSMVAYANLNTLIIPSKFEKNCFSEIRCKDNTFFWYMQIFLQKNPRRGERLGWWGLAR